MVGKYYLLNALTFSLNIFHERHINYPHLEVHIKMIRKTDSSLLNWIYKHVVDFTDENDKSGLTWNSTNDEALRFMN